MNKKILIICLAVLGLVVLSGRSIGGKAKKYCIENGYSKGEWVTGHLNDGDYSFYCIKQVRGETISNAEYYNIKECGEKICPEKIFEHPHTQEIKEDKTKEVIDCYESGKKIIKSWDYPACVGWCNAKTEDGYNMCKVNCKFEGYVCV